MKHVTLTEDIETSKGRMCRHAIVKLPDTEADGLIGVKKAELYKQLSAVEKAEISAAAAEKAEAQARAESERAERVLKATEKKTTEKKAAAAAEKKIAVEKPDAKAADKKAAAAKKATGKG